MSAPNDDLLLSDDEDHIDFDSPSAPKKTSSPDASPPPKPQRTESRYTAEEARDAALRRELDQVKSVNKVIEDVVESLDKARNNMHTVHRTVTSASTLLHTWTRILSATEHNQRLILNPAWQGATRDLADLEADALARQHEAERRERDALQRREAAQRRAEEDELRRAEAATAPAGGGGSRGRRGGLRGRGAAGAAGRTTPGAGQRGGGGGRGTASSRSGSGIGRGVRGRGRGV